MGFPVELHKLIKQILEAGASLAAKNLNLYRSSVLSMLSMIEIIEFSFIASVRGYTKH